MIVGFINQKLKYFKIISKSIGKTIDPRDIKEPIYNQWEDYLEEYREYAP